MKSWMIYFSILEIKISRKRASRVQDWFSASARKLSNTWEEKYLWKAKWELDRNSRSNLKCKRLIMYRHLPSTNHKCLSMKFTAKKSLIISNKLTKMKKLNSNRIQTKNASICTQMIAIKVTDSALMKVKNLKFQIKNKVNYHRLKKIWSYLNS